MKIKKLFLAFVLFLAGCSGVSYDPYHFLDSEQRINNVMNSVVALVDIDVNTGQQRTFCTAFFVRPRVLATAAHCVPSYDVVEVAPGLNLFVPKEPEIGTEFTFATYSQRQQLANHEAIIPHVAKLAAFDVETDVAILELKPNELSSVYVLRMNTSNSISVGDPVYALGHPVGILWYLTQGVISKLEKDSNGRITMINADANVFFGNSGGCLISSSGVIGVTSAMMARQSHLGFFSPISNVVRLLNQLH